MSMSEEGRFFTGNTLFLLAETFESPPTKGTAYLDRGQGWFATLDEVTAEEASHPVAPGGTTIAGQVEHSRYYLNVILTFLHGGSVKADWPGSWALRTVDEAAWTALKASLKDEYERVKAGVTAVETWNDDRMGEAMSIVVHSAYHLGAVRQMIKVVRGGAPA